MTKSQHECSCARSIVPPERARSHSCILNRIWFLIGQNLFDKFLSRLWTHSELFHYHLFPQKLISTVVAMCVHHYLSAVVLQYLYSLKVKY